MNENRVPEELPEKLAHRVQVARMLKEKIFELQQELDEINADLRYSLPEGHYAVDGRPALSVCETRRFSADRAKDVLMPEQAELCSEWLVTSAKAKRFLPPALYAQCQATAGKNTVRYL